MTLTKLAKLANVSLSTASKAFSMSSEVNEETRERIFKIAKQHGCFKKFYKAKYPKYVIAVICPEFKSRYYSMFLSSLQEYLKNYNCEISVASTDFCEKTKNELVEYYNKYTSVDGVILLAKKEQTEENIEIPVVTVSTDFAASLKEAIQYFISKNVTKIGFIGEKLTESKKKEFCDLMEDIGLTVSPNFISISDRRFEEGGYDAMEKILASEEFPRAIVCAYDNMAIGAIRCIYDHGLQVPEDIAVLGFDDIRESKFLNPPLSSINHNIDKACRLATEAIMEKIMNNCGESHIKAESKLHLRQSTKI